MFTADDGTSSPFAAPCRSGQYVPFALRVLQLDVKDELLMNAFRRALPALLLLVPLAAASTVLSSNSSSVFVQLLDEQRALSSCALYVHSYNRTRHEGERDIDSCAPLQLNGLSCVCLWKRRARGRQSGSQSSSSRCRLRVSIASTACLPPTPTTSRQAAQWPKAPSIIADGFEA